jgi:hypothetical protein
MIDLTVFKDTNNFYNALQKLFQSFNIPVSYIDENSIKPQDLLVEHYKSDNDSHKMINDIFLKQIRRLNDDWEKFVQDPYWVHDKMLNIS